MPINPADSKVFGTLYGSDAMRAVFDDRAYLGRMLQVEAALARVQARLGIIPTAAAERITEAASTGPLETEALATSVRNVGYPVVGVVAGLSERAGDAGGWTHWGATTQDIMDTALVLMIRDGLGLIKEELAAIVRALGEQAEAHRHTVMAGRTHLQQALPITFGLKCAIWMQPFVAHLGRLSELGARVLCVQFGGAAGTLASLGAQGLAAMEGLAAELDLIAPPAPWHAVRDGFAEVASFLGLVSGSLAKIATDVALLGQSEVAELAEPYVLGRGSSSTMPQKRNPIAAEYVLAATRVVQALVPVMMGAMAADHERATGPWQAELLALPQAFVLTHGALLHTRSIAEGMVVDAVQMRRNLDEGGGVILAEAVMMGLAPHLGRGQAHEVVSRAANRAREEHTTLTQALAREPAVTAHLDEEAIGRLADPTNYLGSASSFIDRVLANARAMIDGAAGAV
jgi:3-carboxy-cis,cis-muconate cycloisomerase